MDFAFAKRLAKVEEKSAGKLDIGQRIHAARIDPPAPTHARNELEDIARGGSTAARIARGWLRIGFALPRSSKRASVPEIDPEAVLPAMAGYLYDKPLDFVLFSYEWGHDRALRVVELPAPWDAVYESEYGPDTWACELLEAIGIGVRERGFDGSTPVAAQRHAISSGHGIGKGAMTSWLTGWIMTTRPNARGVITANTSPQLESKTWAQVATWNKRGLFANWFDLSTGKGNMRMTHRERPESWRCDAQTCREEASESFAGLHAADSTPFYIFDEASAIPEKIWEVSEGGLTDGEGMWYAFGNPTRNTGRFFECFNGQRHRWVTRQIDSREVQITNKTLLQEWVDDYGEDSDFVKVRVRGVFPRASSMQFIDRATVDEAMRRELPPEVRGLTAILGVDVARFGDDQSVIRTRIGRDARTWEPIRLRGADTMTLASKVGEHANYLRGLGLSVAIFVDGGGVGGGVVDRLRQLGYTVQEVQFGSRATDPRRHANKRAEMWDLMREWLKGGCIPEDEQLATDLTGVEYGFTATDQVQLERKQDMKRRGLASPDDGDALAVTFAFPVPIAMRGDTHPTDAEKAREYDPLEFLQREFARVRVF